MNQAIANIIRNHISGLDFVDKIAGLVAPMTFGIKDKDNNIVEKTVPIACCISADDCKEGAYNELMPNSEYKTVIYFEDQGVTFGETAGRYTNCTSKLRLVCWINVAKILGDTCNEGTACSLSTKLIVEIIRTLPQFPEHHYPFNLVMSRITGQEVRNPSIFSSYTYDEKHSQYLMYPYDYFALDIETTFSVCLSGTGLYNSDCNVDMDSLAAPVATAGTGMTGSSFIAHCNAVSGAAGYSLDVATDAGFTDFVLMDERIGSIRDVTITGLNENTTYYYRFRAYNDYTESGNSNVITVSTLQVTFMDWFLPSKDELNEMYVNLHLFGVGGFNANNYHCSSEANATNSWLQKFSDGSISQAGKAGTYNVRACRVFTGTAGEYSLRDTGPAGGLIFYVSGTMFYEAAPTDQATIPSGHEWSNIINVAVTGTGTAIGTGQANTTLIIAQPGHTDSAAKLCDELIITNP